jgi:hypothetical protein
MSEKNIWIWFLAGLLPHHFKKQGGRKGYTVEIQALFWSLQYASGDWVISVPLLRWLQHSIWTAVMNENIIWIWFLAGLLPHHFKKHLMKGSLTLEAQALFWSFYYIKGKWVIRVPFIERLRNVIHKAICQ